MMKAVYILVGIAVVAGLAFILVGGNEAEAPADTSSATEDATSNDSETSMSPSEEESEMPEAEAEAEVGSDVGMEFPNLEGAASVEADASADVSGAPVKEFTIDAFNFGYSMDEIRVNQGDRVTITLTNSDGFHDWVVDEFNAATERISTGDTATVTFVADEAGSFEYYCSVGSHRAQGMVGTLIVE